MTYWGKAKDDSGSYPEVNNRCGGKYGEEDMRGFVGDLFLVTVLVTGYAEAMLCQCGSKNV